MGGTEAKPILQSLIDYWYVICPCCGVFAIASCVAAVRFGRFLEKTDPANAASNQVIDGKANPVEKKRLN